MKNNSYKKIAFTLSGIFLPAIAFAQFALENSNFKSIVEEAVSYLDLINPILISLALLAFGWGLAKIVLHSDNAAEVKNGRNYILWGIGAVFCLLALSGIIAFIQAQFGFDTLDGGVWGLLLPSSP